MACISDVSKWIYVMIRYGFRVPFRRFKVLQIEALRAREIEYRYLMSISYKRDIVPLRMPPFISYLKDAYFQQTIDELHHIHVKNDRLP